MYRIVCESYENYIKDFQPNDTDSYRYKVMEPFKLITDLDLYRMEKDKNSLDYMKIEDFLFLAKEEMDKYPNIKSFMWSLESRGINGKSFGVLKKEDFQEMMKVLNMFLKLSYWN